MNMNEKKEALYDLILSLKTREDCEALFEDLCTYKEVENMADRIYVAKLLLSGQTYNDVIEVADVSSATVSRVSRCLKYGKGYSRLLKK